MENKLLLGVDAGGTRTRASVAESTPDGSFRIIGRGEAGPGNPASMGIDTASRSLREAILQALSKCQGSPEQIGSSVLAIAGSGGLEITKQLEAWAEAFGLTAKTSVVTDVAPLLRCGDITLPSVGVVAGTGSIALARSIDGSMHRLGGYGYLLGDEGSGFDIGRRVVRRVLADDSLGRVPARINQVTLDHFGVDKTCSLPGAIHTNFDPRGALSTLAKTTCQLAKEDDAIAIEVIAEAAGDLASTTMAVAQLAAIDQCPVEILLTGGVILGSTQFRELLLDALRDQGLSIARATLVEDVTQGALAMAAELFTSNSS